MTGIEEANRLAAQRILDGTPYLMGIGRADEVIPGMKANLILHAGRLSNGRACPARCAEQ